MRANDSEINNIVKKIWENILTIEITEYELSFFALGGTSMQAYKTLTEINQNFGLTLDIFDFFDAVTINDLTKLIVSKIA